MGHLLRDFFFAKCDYVRCIAIVNCFSFSHAKPGTQPNAQCLQLKVHVQVVQMVHIFFAEISLEPPASRN